MCVVNVIATVRAMGRSIDKLQNSLSRKNRTEFLIESMEVTTTLSAYILICWIFSF